MSDLSDKLLLQGYQARREDRLADAERNFAEAVELCRVDGGVALARALTGLGQVERDVGRYDVARQHYEEALAIYRAEGDPLKVAHTVRQLGDLHQEEGRPYLAAPCYDEALSLYRHEGRTSVLDLANAIRSFAILKEDTGKAEEARRLWEEAKELYTAVNVKEGVVESSNRLSRLAQRRQDRK
jgi:tetratricopeptide (TPR) repeat protein